MILSKEERRARDFLVDGNIGAFYQFEFKFEALRITGLSKNYTLLIQLCDRIQPRNEDGLRQLPTNYDISNDFAVERLIASSETISVSMLQEAMESFRNHALRQNTHQLVQALSFAFKCKKVVKC